jgi:hypothetical protein
VSRDDDTPGNAVNELRVYVTVCQMKQKLVRSRRQPANT